MEPFTTAHLHLANTHPAKLCLPGTSITPFASPVCKNRPCKLQITLPARKFNQTIKLLFARTGPAIFASFARTGPANLLGSTYYRLLF